MTPFLAKGARTYKGRITDRHGVTRIVSYGTRVPDDAKAIGKTLAWLREHRQWDVIDLILSKAITPPQAHDAHVAGELARLVKETNAKVSTAVAQMADPELDGLVDEWAETAFFRYVPQVRLFVASLPAAARRLTSFRRREISRFLAELKVSGSTKRRYRTALSQFAVHLVERELLDTNPVRDVRGAKENRPRMVFHTRDEAKALIKVLEGPQMALESLMAGTGIEYGAARLVRRRDVDPGAKSVWAEGSKTEWRARRVFFTEEWAWEAFWSHARNLTPAALVCAIPSKRALEQHRAGCKAAKVKPSRLHDWRHTYAIYSLQDGMARQAVKRQLGHSPHSTMLERVYSAWLPEEQTDYSKRAEQEPSATKSATNSPQKSAVRSRQKRGRVSA